MRQKFKFFVAAAMGLLVCFSLHAQMTTSSISGKVTDAQGAVPGAAVIAVHTPSGTQYYALSNGEGLYTIQGMRPGGPYEVTVQLLGYKTVVFKDITLQLSETYAQDIVLEDAAEQLQEVVVVASATRFGSEKTGASTNVSNREMMNLPNSGRSFSALTKLSPYASGMSFAGSDGRSTNVTIDGANFNNNFGLSDKLPGGGTPISLDAIEEIQLVVAPFDVRQSNFVGGGINAVTKSGTNTFKGTAYMYYYNQHLRGNKLDGEDLGARDPESNKIYGFTLGGPIVKNKLFFFVNFEMQKKPEQTIQYQTTDKTKIDMLNRIANKLRNDYGYEPGSFTDYPGGTDNWKVLARIDWNISDAHKLSVRYNNTVNKYWYSPNGNSCDDAYRNKNYNRASEVSQPFSNNMYSQQNNVWSVAAELNSRFSNNVSNRLIATYTDINDQRGSNSAYFPHIDIMSGDTSEGNYIPYTSLGYELFTYNNGVKNTVLNIQDNLTWYLGSHTLTAGLSFENQKARNSYMRNGTGYFRYASPEDFLNGNLPLSFVFTYGNNGDENPAGKINYNQYGAYVQDEWKATDNFKLTYGIRADMIAFNDADLLTNNAIKAIDYGGKSIDTGKWPKTRVQVSPRLGFNWDVLGDRSLIVRGGSGLFQGRLPLVFFTNMPQNAGMIQTTVKYTSSLDKKTGKPVYPADVTAALMKLNGGTATGGHIETDYTKYVGLLGLNTTVTEKDGQIGKNADINAVDQDFHMPQIWKTSLAVDYQLPVNFPLTVTAEGMFNKTIWGTRLVNWNINESKLSHFTQGPDKRVLYPSTGYLYGTNNAYVLTNSREGWGYTANLTINAQPAKNLKLMATYTHTESKEISGMPGSAASSAYTGLASIDGPNFLPLQRSQYVTPDKFAANISYYLDWIGGWQFDLYYSGYSAYGNSFTYSNDMNGDGIAYDLMYIPATKNEIAFKTDADRDAFWSFLEQDKYLSSHKGQYAEAYAARSPFVHRFDARIAKDIKFKIGNTKHNFQISASIDNIGNMLNSSWGLRKQAYSQSSYISPLKYEGLNDAGQPYFSMNKDKNTNAYPTQTYTQYYKNTSECWQILFGIKYFFN